MLFTVVVAPSVRAALSVTSIGAPVTINFDTTVTDVNDGQFAGNGFDSTTTSGQLDSDSWAVFRNGGDDPPTSSGALAFGGTQETASTTWTRGTSPGGVSTGGIYAFDVSNGGTVDRAIGVQPAGGMTFDGSSGTNSGKITLKVTNNTGVTVSSWSVSFDVYVFNDEGRSSTVAFLYAPNSSDTTGTLANGTIYTAAGVNVVTAETAAASPAWVKNSQTVAIPQSIANGASLNIRWNIYDSGGGGSRDELAIDNLGVAAIPEPSAFLFGGLVCGVIGLGIGGRRLIAKLCDRG